MTHGTRALQVGYLRLQTHTHNMYRGIDKSLPLPGRRQANVPVRMA